MYTLLTVPGGIAVRAEVAQPRLLMLPAPELPDGAQYGAPGWGNNPTRRVVWAHSAFGVGNARCGSAIARRS